MLIFKIRRESIICLILHFLNDALLKVFLIHLLNKQNLCSDYKLYSNLYLIIKWGKGEVDFVCLIFFHHCCYQ